MKFFQYVPVKPDTNYPIYTITKRGTIELKTEIIPFELLTESEMKKDRMAESLFQSGRC